MNTSLYFFYLEKLDHNKYCWGLILVPCTGVILGSAQGVTFSARDGIKVGSLLLSSYLHFKKFLKLFSFLGTLKTFSPLIISPFFQFPFLYLCISVSQFHYFLTSISTSNLLSICYF